MKKAFLAAGIFLLALIFCGKVCAEEVQVAKVEAPKAEVAKPEADKVESCKSEAVKAKKSCSGEPLDAANMGYDKTALNKLGRGAINTLTCLGEVPASIYEVSAEKGEFLGCTLGLGRGILNTVVRGVTGIFDIVTFIIPPYNKPLMKPEYAFQSFDQSFQKYDDR